MPAPVSARFLAELSASNPKSITQVQIWNKDSYLATLPNVTDGSVSMDDTRSVRRTCTVTIADQGRDFDDYIPVNPGDLLHPASGNEMHILRGFQYSDGTQELTSLGIFRLSKPIVKDTGDKLTMQINGNDRSAFVAKLAWTTAYPIVTGTEVGAAVIALINNRWPNSAGTLDFNVLQGKNPVTNLYYYLPPTTLGTTLLTNNNPWQDAVDLASVALCELYFDPNGVVTMTLIPNPVTQQTNLQFTPSSLSTPSAAIYTEGDNATFSEVDRTLDETQMYNGVIAIGNGPGGPPVQAVVWDTDPNSPTYYDPNNPSASPVGPQPYIYQTAVIPGQGMSPAQAQTAIQAAAEAQFAIVHTVLDTPSLTCVPNPALWDSDIIQIVRSRIGLNSTYAIAQMTIPLMPDATMSIVCRARPQQL